MQAPLRLENERFSLHPSRYCEALGVGDNTFFENVSGYIPPHIANQKKGHNWLYSNVISLPKTATTVYVKTTEQSV